jgi:hypothetical protein
MINWKYREQASANDIHNKTIVFATDIFLILIEECVRSIDRQQLNIRVVELIKRVNQNEMNFLPKLKSVHMLCRHFDAAAIAIPLNYNQILSDFRAFMVQPH